MAATSICKADPYSYREARALADGLGVSDPVAITLVRRGYRTVEAARAFLDADESHPPTDFRSMPDVVGRVLTAIEAGKRIVVHGDFDVDGVCATTIMVSALRDLGADCGWLIPDRLADGYGLAAEGIEGLAEANTSMLVTVDCGVTAVEEVALAQSVGIEVIVTDHHQPGEELPNCPILHPALDGYPFPDLCGTAVAWKLACAVREASGVGSPGTPREGAPENPISDDSRDIADLDLVALATVADVVPLVGENRALVRRGLEEMRHAHRPGMRALLKAAGCEPTRLDEGDLSFRLAPRINAAGRLYRADAGVELFLTADEARASEIAVELNGANGKRREIERKVSSEAAAARRELPDHLRDAPAVVVAGQGWHPGVIGIVASRLVERHYCPAIVIALDGEGGGRGSGRSIPGFDLLAGLQACSEHLVRFGGHRAAAGLEIEADRLEAFRAAFVAHVREALPPGGEKRTERIDAMVGGAGLSLGLAEELERMGPFGIGNPGVRLLVPSAHVGDVQTMGKGKHARFSLRSGSHRALAVAFGRSQLGVEGDEAVDAAVRLEVNRWNGSVEPRVVLRELYPLEAAGDGESLHGCECPTEEWWGRFERERAVDLDAVEEMPAAIPEGGRTAVTHEASAAAVIAELLSSGAGVLAICADASRRAGLANGAAGLARFNGGVAGVVCARCPEGATAKLSTRAAGGLALTDYPSLLAAPGLVGDFEHVALVDPPPSARAEGIVTGPFAGREGTPGPGFLHRLWSEAEVPFAISALEDEFAQRRPLVAVFRDLRDTGKASGEALLAALRGGGAHARSPEAAARCFRVLAELGILSGTPDGGNGTVGVVSSKETNLERSAAFRAYTARYQESRRFLDRRKQP